MARPVSAETVAIRKLLDQNKDLTYTEAVPLLAAQGITVTDIYFNAAKQGYRRLQEQAKPKVRKVEKTVDPKEAFAFIVDNGGLDAVQKDILKRIAYVKAFKQVMKQAA